MLNKLLQIWAQRQKEEICPLCQSIRLALAALCGSGLSSSYGGFAATLVVAFLLGAFLTWHYRTKVMVYVTRVRIWFAQRRDSDSGAGD